MISLENNFYDHTSDVETQKFAISDKFVDSNIILVAGREFEIRASWALDNW